MRIDACVNHCVLFRKEFANEDKCPICLAPRWKGADECSDDDNGRRTMCLPRLVLRHFPFIPKYPSNHVGSLVSQVTQPFNIPTQDLEGISKSLDTQPSEENIIGSNMGLKASEDEFKSCVAKSIKR